MTDVFVGIDVGLKGAIACLSETPEPLVPAVVSLEHMPTYADEVVGKPVVEPVALYSMCHRLRDAALVVVEKAQTFGHESRSSCFSFGGSYYVTRAMLKLHGLHGHAVVRPQEWQREVLGATSKGGTKGASVALCKSLWPHLDLRRPGFPQGHDGLADALCLALYARKLYYSTLKGRGDR